MFPSLRIGSDLLQLIQKCQSTLDFFLGTLSALFPLDLNPESPDALLELIDLTFHSFVLGFHDREQVVGPR